MELLYLINSQDKFLFIEKTKEIIKENNLNKKIKTISFNLEEKNEINELINEINTNNFFFIKKIIINLENWNKIKKNQKEKLLKIFKKSKNFIFFWNNLKIKKNFKEIEEISLLQKISKITKSKKEKFIKNQLEKNHIFYEKEIINWIALNVLDDFFTLNNEMQKIIFYFFTKNKILKLNDVKKILTVFNNKNVFELFNEILKNNIKKSIKIYNKILKEKTSINSILILLETYIWNIKKIQILQKQNLNYKKIAIKLNKNPFFILNLIKILNIQKKNDLISIIEKWCLLEYNIKSVFLTPDLVFKLFLIK